METFKYLKKEKSNSILSKYSLEELKEKIIIQNNKDQKYYLFNNKTDFQSFIFNLEDKDRTYNEIILDDIQKFKVDLDYEIDADAEEAENILTEENVLIFINLIIKEFYKLLKNKKVINNQMQSKNYYIFDSSTDKKISYHIVFDVYFNNSMQTKKLAYELLDILKNKIKKNNLPKLIIKTFDTSVYKSTQSFRLPFNCKYGKDNLKKCINQKDLSIFDAMINPMGNKNNILLIQNIYKEEEKKINEINIDDDIVQKVIKIATENGYLENMELREIIANRLIFNRNTGGDCKLCGRIHDNENNVYIILCNNLFRIYCRRNDDNFVEYKLENDDFNIKFNRAQYVKKLIENINTDIIEIPTDEILKKFEKCDNKIIYKENKMREYNFNDKRVLLVKANMKLGKTKALRDYLEKTKNENVNVVFISFRVLFTLDVNKNFSDFKNYLTINKNKISIKEHKKIIIQIESLHKLTLDVIPDLLILDESESIFGQFTSPYCKNKIRTVWEIYEFLLKVSKKIICMDANLGERTFNVFNKIYPIENMYLHMNTYSTMAQDEYIFISNMQKFVEKIDEMVKLNKKLVIPVNSLKTAKLINHYLTTTYKEKKICLYSSESDDFIKKKDLSNVNKEWLKYDIIIYTPSITAGISFEEKHFDCIFGYFTNRSCDVYTLLQMLYRVRNVKEKKIYIFVDIMEVYENIPCTRSDIIENINYSIKYLVNEMINYKIEYNFETNEVLNKINTDDIYYTLWEENKYIYFNSLISYYKNLLIILKRNNCIIKFMDERNDKENKLDIKNILAIINYEENEKVLKTKNIDEAEYELISNKILLTEEEKFCKKKYFLKQIYNNDYENFTLEFLEIYNKPEMINICINLNKVRNFTKTFEEIYSYVLNNVIYDNNINNINSLNILSIEEIIHIKKILILIELIGLNIMNFDLQLTIEELNDNIIKNKALINESIKYINRNLNYKIKISNDIDVFCKNISNFIKKILNETFGIKFINKENKSGKEIKWIQIERSALFNDKYPVKIVCNNSV